MGGEMLTVICTANVKAFIKGNIYGATDAPNGIRVHLNKNAYQLFTTEEFNLPFEIPSPPEVTRRFVRPSQDLRN